MLAFVLMLQTTGGDADLAAMQCTMNAAYSAEAQAAAADVAAARVVDDCLRSYPGDAAARAAARARLVKMAATAISQARARAGAR